MVRNQAFVFIKPQAMTDKVKELAKEVFEAKGIKVTKEGAIESEEIDKKMLIDKHYYAIASKATLVKPDKLPVPKDKFKEFFGVDFDDMLKADKVFNAKDACEKLGKDADEIDKMWGAAKKDKKLIKFGGGFYCGKLPCGDDEIYTFNAFFMSMRSKFVEKGASIYYFLVEWDSSTLSWADFRGKVLGPTDPKEAPEDSLRGSVLKKWKELDLKSEPNVGDNAVHASASPFEAFAERSNWLGYRADRDPFGKLLLKAGISRATIKEWSNDPQVTFGVLPITKSLFDSVEDMDTDLCLANLQMMAASSKEAQKESKKASPLEKEVAKLKEQLAAYEELGKAVSMMQGFKAAKIPEPEPKAKAKAKAKSKAKPKKDKKEKKEE